MSIGHWISVKGQGAPDAVGRITAEALKNVRGAAQKAVGTTGLRPLHRLAETRKRQGISLRNMARRLRVSEVTVLEQEKESSDPLLSTIYAWQKVLEVPVADLLVESDAPLSTAVFARARLVKLMKTAATILEKAHGTALRQMVTVLIEQLVEIMPELRDVAPWNTAGRRTLEDYGRAVERQLPDDFVRRMKR